MDLLGIYKVLSAISYKGQKNFCSAQPVMFGEKVGINVRVYIHVNDRVTGDDTTLWTHYTFCPEEHPFITKESLVRRVKSMIVYLETHEVEERLLYKGRRVFDPHAPKLRGPNVKVEKRIYDQKIANTKTEIIKQLKEREANK